MKFANNSANTNGTGAALIAYDGPCVFFSLHVSTGASGGYVMLFDSRSAPGKGDRPKRVWDVDEAQSFDHETANGIPMQNGCVIALSSTQFTFTSFAVEVLIDAVFYIPPPPAPPKTDPLPEDPALKPSPAPQRPPPASTPAGRPAPTSKPLKGTVAALLLGFLTLCSSGWAATSTTPGSSGGGYRVAAGTNITAQTNGIVVTINANSSASGGSSNLLWARTRFVDAYNGNDATAVLGEAGLPWLTPYAALNAAVSGEVVYGRNGFFDVGTNPCIVKPGVTFTGAGLNSFWVRGAAGLLTNGPIVTLGSTSAVSHMTIECFKRDNYNQAALGCFSAATNTQPAFTNAIVHDVRLIGDSDAWYLRHASTCSLEAWAVLAESKWDCMVAFSEGSGHRYRFKACTFLSDLRGALNPQSISVATATPVKVQGGTVEFIGCEAVATNANTTVALVVSGGAVRWSGGLLRSAGTNAPCRLIENTGGTLEYFGNQATLADTTGPIIWGNQQFMGTNAVYPIDRGLIFTDADGLNPPILITPSAGFNVGATNDPGAGVLSAATANFRDGAAVGKIWTCTNTATGQSEWKSGLAVSLIASNATTAQADFTLTGIGDDTKSTDVMRANLALQLTNLVAGRALSFFLTGDTNANDRTVSVSTNGITGGAAVRWNLNSPTNGATSFTVTNNTRIELSLKCLSASEVWAVWGAVR